MSLATAWASWAEWLEVYKLLASTSPDERGRGVAHVQTWRARTRLPVSVDVSASFIEVLLHDPVVTPTTEAPRSDHELQLMYAMIVIRLVNGIVDAAQTVRKRILDRAKELEWPQWFVELRHEAAHGKLPALNMLRCAAKEAVFLLLQRYWRPQAAQIERRGRGRILRIGEEHSRPPPVVTADTVDRKLKSLFFPSSVAKSQTELLVEEALRDKMDPVAIAVAEEAVAVRAHEMSALAWDEARLLDRLLAIVFPRKPGDDQARALQLLLAEGSDNLSLRVAREVLLRSLGCTAGISGMKSLKDERPCVRSIADDYLWNQSSSSKGGFGSVSAGEANRMLEWIDILLQTPTRSKGDPTRSPFALAVWALEPVLRKFVAQAASLCSLPGLPLARDPKYKPMKKASRQGAAGGVGSEVQGMDGELWGTVTSEEGKLWRLDTGRIAKKAAEGTKWVFSEATTQEAAGDSDKARRLSVEELSDRAVRLFEVLSKHNAVAAPPTLPLLGTFLPASSSSARLSGDDPATSVSDSTQTQASLRKGASLESIEAFVASKKRGTPAAPASESQEPSSAPPVKRRRTIRRAYEPWTAIGTFFCPETLRIFCPGNSSGSFRTPTPDNEVLSDLDVPATEVGGDVDAAGEAGRASAAAAAATAAASAKAAEEEEASGLVGDLDDVVPSPLEEGLDQGQLAAAAEAAFRSGAAAAFANGLRPL